MLKVSHLLSGETYNCNVEVSNLINNNAPVHQLQRVQGAPISIYTCTNAEQMAFPWLYPDGTNGYKTSRDPPITTLDYFQSRHLSSDAHWASHIPYLFWSVNVLAQRRLNENISVAVRMRSSGNTCMHLIFKLLRVCVLCLASLTSTSPLKYPLKGKIMNCVLWL